MPVGRTNLNERYELGEVLGRGGKGVVYRATDRIMQREVALKTLLDIDDPLSLELFYKDYGVLAAMLHPNIVTIYDVGEFQDNGVTKPFFAMPLLSGATLDRVFRRPDSRLTADSLIAIVSQACRALQAAHEMGLVHRNIKPSNIFLLSDNSVKVVDFGTPRAASLGSMTAMRGTLAYLAPEQLHYEPPTGLSDQYSLAVVCYEALARRLPFQGAAEAELADAILRQAPAPVSDVNPGVPRGVSQTILKALSKQPSQRFPTMREFGDALNRALRGTAVESLADKIKPRLDRATAAFEQGDFEFASELLSELENEGCRDESMTALRQRLEESMARARVRQLLDTANRYLRAQEDLLALRKVQQALEIDPENDEAMRLKNEIEAPRGDNKIDEWLQLARVQVEHQLYEMARKSLTAALKVRPDDPAALSLMAEVKLREEEATKLREQKAALYESAVQARERGELTNALGKLDELLSIERSSPDSAPERSTAYQTFYQQVKSEYDARLAKVQAATDPESPWRAAGDKTEIVATLVGKAQAAEQRQAFTEAFGHWQAVKQLEPDYPGVEQQIARVAALREGQSGQTSKQGAIDAIGRAIRAGDYDRAQSVMDEARREYPHDSELTACEAHIRDRRERTAEALALVEQARAHAAANATRDARLLLREAQALDGGNPTVRATVMSVLLELARTLMSRDPELARQVIDDLLRIEPGHAEAKILQGQLVTGKRQEFVNACLEQARAMQAQGNVIGALVMVRRGLSSYPQDPALQQMEAALGGPPRTVVSPPPPPATPVPVTPSSFEDATTNYFQMPVTPAPPAPPPMPPLDTASTNLFQPSPPPSTSTSEPLSTPPPPLPPAVETKPPGKKPKWLPAALVAAGVFASLAAGGIYMRFRNPGPKAPPQTLSKITLRATPQQASIAVDGRTCGNGSCAVELPPGQHRVEASLDGYDPASGSFEIQPGAPAPAPPQLVLTPRLPVVVVSTNLNQASITLDKGAQQPVRNGEMQLTNLAAGRRTLKFTGEGGQGLLAFTIAPAAPPAVQLPIQQQNLGATLVSSMGGSAKVFTTLQKAEALLDGKSAGKVEPTGVDLTNLAPGPHELVVTAQNISHRLNFTAGPSPGMAVFFGIERNQGVLRITTGENDVAVYVNGSKTRRTTQNGRLILYLEPKTYKIRVEKAGFQPVAEVSVEIKRGEEVRTDFQMARLPQVGAIVVQKAPAGAEVTLDGAAAGPVHPDGTLALNDLKPGSHTVAIKKESYRPVTRQVNVIAGQEVEVDGALQSLVGSVKINLVPADLAATLSWTREGEDGVHAFIENPLTLPEGSYTIVGRAPGYEDARVAAKITAGRAASADLVFRKIVVAKVEPVKPPNPALADVEKAGGWTRENSVLTRVGGNNVLLPIAPAAGTYVFQAMMQKGKHLLWLVNYVDAKNYVLYDLSEDRLERTEFLEGKKTNAAKPKLKVKLDQWIQVTLEVSSGAIVVTVQQDAGKWTDRTAQEGPTLTPYHSYVRGKFGFRVPGRDRLAVGSFSFTPK